MFISTIRNKIKQNSLPILIVTIFLLVQSIPLFKPADIWWDSAVYVGMGKFIYSSGNVGLWEASRPIVWPLALGLFWKIGLSPIFFGEIIVILLSVGCLIITYLIAKSIFDKNTALISLTLLAFSPTFFLFTSVIQTEIPSLFLALLSTFLLIKNKYELSGLFLGIAVMTRFFAILATIPILLWLLSKSFEEKKAIIPLFKMGIFFLVPIIPYLILNQFMYRDMLYPFSLQAYMTLNTGWVFNQPFYFYLLGLIKENILTIFSLLGVILAYKEKGKLKNLLILILLFALIPFNFIAHKEMRFLLLALPYLYIMASYGVVYFSEKFRNKQKLVISSTVLISLLLTAPNLRFNQYDDDLNLFYDYLKKTEMSGDLWVTNPSTIIYCNYKANLIYYPVFNSKKIRELDIELINAGHILLNTCDIPCPPKEKDCEEAKKKLIKNLKNNFKIANQEKIWECELYIFERY